MPEALQSNEVTLKLVESLKIIRQELERLYQESKSNSTKIQALSMKVDKASARTPVPSQGAGVNIDSLTKQSSKNAEDVRNLASKLDQISSQPGLSQANKKDIEVLRDQIQKTIIGVDMPNVTTKLKTYDGEFKELYSSVGKERVEIDQLALTMDSLKKDIAAWQKKTNANMNEAKTMKSELKQAGEKMKVIDTREELEEVTQQLSKVVERVDELQSKEQEILEAQVHMIAFDKNMKELMRKAVAATMSRQEFEKEFDALKSAKANQPKKKIQSKLQQLREHMESAKKEAPPKPAQMIDEGDELLDDLERLEKDLAEKKEPPATVWANARNDFMHTLNAEMNKAKIAMEKRKSEKKDVSKLNIAITKQNLGIVSLETAFAMKKFQQVKEITKRLLDLRVQVSVELAS